jgi:hypothetical protein
MKPGQFEPNEFEAEILARLAGQESWLVGPLRRLHVLSREYTSVGSFTNFLCNDCEEREDRMVGLEGLIHMPGVANGMGAVLTCKGTQPDCLEVFTYGDDHWDGTYFGFSIEQFQIKRTT